MKFTKAIIFPATAKFGPALVLVLVACSVTFAQDVRTNYMPGTDFSKYHAYAWVNDVRAVPAVGGHPDQILDASIFIRALHTGGMPRPPLPLNGEKRQMARG